MTNILFVDDDSFMLSAYQRMMRHSGYHSYFLQQAELLWQQDYLADLDIVFADQMMPGCSGSELLLRLQHQHPSVKRVLLTGDVGFIQQLSCNGLKIHKWLEKPCSKERLLQCIRALLTKKVG
jgi:DNA-binding NtrC family response regulator